ncbi:MAG: peptide chain release factor 2 [Acidimicrobiia bacterium]|nr:peptide chain release factor 2 [Acidimicrobiia bacterium]
MHDITDDLKALRRRLEEAEGYLKIDELRARQPQLETEASRPDLWDDQEKARKVTTELTSVNDDLDAFSQLSGAIDDAATLYDMAREEGDETLEPELDQALVDLSGRFDELELRSLFSGEHDEHDAICEVHSGAGGTDSQDWAEMLLRMYLRWAERRGFEVELDSVSAGQEAGITSATFIVKGRYAYGLLQAERGVHRLVRISPFDSAARRHTAFASVAAVPFLDKGEIEINIDEKDLRIDTYRSSGAGGQHVNVTDSAVRITHLPTGLVTSCQNERSQRQNKERAMQVMAAKLADLERQNRAAELAAIAGEQREVGWGSQIRSYVLHPYQMVKDLRTDHEVGAVEAVLDGEVGQFMESYLRWRRAQEQGE